MSDERWWFEVRTYPNEPNRMAPVTQEAELERMSGKVVYQAEVDGLARAADVTTIQFRERADGIHLEIYHTSYDENVDREYDGHVSIKVTPEVLMRLLNRERMDDEK